MVIAMTFGANVLDKSKKKAKEAMKSTIEKAARLYYTEEQESTDMCVKLTDLKNKGFIKESELVDANKKYNFNYNKNSGVQITVSNGVITNSTYKESC